MDRRQALQWVVAAAGYIGSRGSGAFAAGATRARGYGTDPDLTKACQPGDLWPLTVAAICDDICNAVAAKEEFRAAAYFFARFRDLTAAGFYTTPAGRNDLNYVGNVPLAAFEGPPLEVLKAAGLA
jgi:hypothetical protein